MNATGGGARESEKNIVTLQGLEGITVRTDREPAQGNIQETSHGVGKEASPCHSSIASKTARTCQAWRLLRRIDFKGNQATLRAIKAGTNSTRPDP